MVLASVTVQNDPALKTNENRIDRKISILLDAGKFPDYFYFFFNQFQFSNPIRFFSLTTNENFKIAVMIPKLAKFHY